MWNEEMTKLYLKQAASEITLEMLQREQELRERITELETWRATMQGFTNGIKEAKREGKAKLDIALLFVVALFTIVVTQLFNFFTK